MKDINGVWCLEYSTSQNCFHKDLLERVLEVNMLSCISRNGNDYQIVYIGTEKRCEEMFETLKQRLERGE